MKTPLLPFLLFLSLCVHAQQPSLAPAEVMSDDYCKDETGTYYYNANDDYTAVLWNRYAINRKYYTLDSIEIASTFYRPGVGPGGSSYGVTYTVVALGEKAFYNAANAVSVRFADDSKVHLIDRLALAAMPKMEDTLVLPASLDSLSLSAIALPNIRKIVFLGATPPRCAVNNGSLTAYNPWTSDNDGATPADIEVEVPDGTKEAYKAAAGIGDYFTCFKQGTPTDLDVVKSCVPAKKYFRNGILYIEREGVRYNAQGNILKFVECARKR